eukprot:2425246-Amphidinium_carterae.1
MQLLYMDKHHQERDGQGGSRWHLPPENITSQVYSVTEFDRIGLLFGYSVSSKSSTMLFTTSVLKSKLLN